MRQHYEEQEGEKMNDAAMAKLCAGECPFGFACKAPDCEECAKLRMEGAEDNEG